MPGYILAIISSALSGVIVGFPLIKLLKRLKFGQEVRNEGPKSHLKKQGTPTMGGVMFFITMPLGLLACLGYSKETLFCLGLMLSLGFVGFLDDFIKIVKHHSEGLTVKQKFIAQILIGLIFGYIMYMKNGGIISVGSLSFNLGIFYCLFGMLVIVASANAVNFTDGLDGLCSGVTIIVMAAYLIFCLKKGLTITACFPASVMASCMAFLVFNIHPAKMFMGDTGSLALGGAVAAMAMVTGTEILLPILGIIYVSEVLSVILQVSYFKLTHGKRLFKMSPLHHHFELCGMNEMEVDLMFWGVTLISGIIYLLITL